MVVSLDPGWELRQYLKDRDAPCPRCGYNLRDLERDCCPECDLYLRIAAVRRVGSRSALRRGRPWMLGLVAALSLWFVVMLIVWRSMASGALPSWLNACALFALGVVVVPGLMGTAVWWLRARAEDTRARRHSD